MITGNISIVTPLETIEEYFDNEVLDNRFQVLGLQDIIQDMVSCGEYYRQIGNISIYNNTDESWY